VVPQFTDITDQSGIRFNHVSASDNRYVVESMSGGVLLIDYDRDGYPDIYFTNAPTVDMALKGQTARGALYHNNHDGTFTDVTDRAGLASPCFAMGGAVGDYNNDRWPAGDHSHTVFPRRAAFIPSRQAGLSVKTDGTSTGSVDVTTRPLVIRSLTAKNAR